MNGHGTSSQEDGLFVEVGSEYLQHGLTQVAVTLDGQVRVFKLEQEEEEKYEARIDGSRAQSLAARAESFRGAGYGERPGLPDEPRYRLLVIRGGSEIAEIEVWRSELREAEELAVLLAELQELVNRASEGRALL